MTPDEPQLFGAFKILDTLKCEPGSQGSVFRAECVGDFPGVARGEVVVLKAMKVEDEGEAFSRLLRRTEALKRITHQNVVRYRGCFVETGPFSSSNIVVTDLLEGETLRERLRANPGGLDADEALRIFDGALAGLACAEEAGITHRDIKPGNIFICRDGTVKLIDFEVARSGGEAQSTASGRFAGTFDYMAPEFRDPAFHGDAASDVFSMGVVMHETLTGQLPYVQKKKKGQQADLVFLSRWSQRMEGLCATKVKESVKQVLAGADAVIAGALAEDRSRRYQRAKALRAAVARIGFVDLENGGATYRLLRQVGQGGFGVVFKAREMRSGNLVAVKQLRHSAYGKRFKKEAEIMRRLDDPAFVRFVDYFEKQSAGNTESFLVMDFLPGMPGSSLRDAIRRRRGEPMPFRPTMLAFALYARALASMHAKGVYHRDIKPSNLYFCESDPRRAVIMDLGIVRDVNGSVTTAQVPGTPDYMPPEIAFGTSRGDAAMDIYALGLSLYEALSGDIAYPRLPTTATMEAFLLRAKQRVKPEFDSPTVTGNPALVQLLEDMTNIDPALRISNAEMLIQRIDEVMRGGVVRPRPTPRPTPRPHAPPAPKTAEAGGLPTRQTALGRLRVAPPRRRWEVSPETKRAVLKIVASLAVVMLIGAGTKMAWQPIQKWHSGRKAEEARRKAAEELAKEQAAEKARLAEKRGEASREADDVLRMYNGTEATTNDAAKAAKAWSNKWGSDKEVREIYTNKVALIEKAKKARWERDYTNEVKRLCRDVEDDAQKVIAVYKDDKISLEEANARKDSWKKKWQGRQDVADVVETWENKICEAQADRQKRDKKKADDAKGEEKRRKKLARAKSEATKACDGIVALYTNETQSVESTQAKQADWEADWSEYREEEFYKTCLEKLGEAFKARQLVESGRQVAKACERTIENVRSINAENVGSWRKWIDQASNDLTRAKSEGRISDAAFKEVENRINECARWKVGVIQNKTEHTAAFVGKKIDSLTDRVVVFTNDIPAGAAIEIEGYEPVLVGAERFDGRAILLLPTDLIEQKGGTTVRLSQVDDGVVCIVDGVARQAGEFALRRGRHRVVYRRTQQTYPGVNDFKEQEFDFATSPDRVTDVPRPRADWIHTEDFKTADKNAVRVAKGRKLVAEIRVNLEPAPVDGRRKRLQTAHGLLEDWKTAEILAAVGSGTQKGLKALYDAEERRIRGIVKNLAGAPATVTTDGEPVVVPAKGEAMVTFEREWPRESYVHVPGYEFKFLPRSREDFDGKTFVVDPAKLVPLPVEITVPELETGVKCFVDGVEKKSGSRFELRPGDFECVYTRPDHEPQKFSFVVKMGEKRTLPMPGAWERSGFFSGIGSAIRTIGEGSAGLAKTVKKEVGTVEDEAHRRELEELKRAVELRKRLEKK